MLTLKNKWGHKALISELDKIKPNHNLVQLLIDARANVNAKDADNTTALMMACCQEDTTIAKMLINNNAKRGFSALKCAKINNRQEIIDSLKSHGAVA